MKPLIAVAGALAALATLTISAQTSWKSVALGRAMSFPADHASHPDYKIEWWYYTGNLDAAQGRRFGYQLTFFRVGVDPSPANQSRWAVRDLFMTHLALTDVNGRRYRFAERMNRAGPGWAGAATGAYRVWNEGWQATLESPGIHRLQASTGGPGSLGGGDGIGVDLSLTENRPPVLHGDRGYSRKGSAEGNATQYYSLTRMPTRGSIVVDGRPVDVTGQSWMDHEFGTSFLETNQAGWDWFSIQLDDGRDLMIFQVRQADGSIDPRSSGTLVGPDGRSEPVTFENGFRLEPGRLWTSPVSGARYPVAWTIRIPGKAIELSVSAAVDGQELHTERSTGVTYWEGAIDVTGGIGGRPVKGRGYLEMTGYSGPSMSTFLR